MDDFQGYDPLLLRAVPSSARADAYVALRSLGREGSPTRSDLIQDTYARVAYYPEIYVAGELVQIPTRIYYPWPQDEQFDGLSASERVIFAAWMSRNGDGRIRQRALRILLDSELPWTVPFVVQLCAEYVFQIGQDILQFVTVNLREKPHLLAAYVQFTNDNPDFMALCTQRATSYWAIYGWQLKKDDYPQFAALRALAELARNSQLLAIPSTI
ncbi:hypothetical protein [Arthrobacter glacialis]|uniref:hypothetical protein n=1 Tax=Arthrobacter glacialis TaxID=1664 RepID=UPI001057406F|nr:hypothetical protein [Arthrobacter glacialis]